jgi:molybdopterin synthase catalytic subunit
MSDKKLKNIFVEGPISPVKIGEDIAHHQKKTNIGAHSIFMGQVRADSVEATTVSAIEYSAHQEMALSTMHEIREAIFAKYPLTCLHITHSLGMVKAGEICLFVFASAVHRKEAIDACEEVVERIKKELPIWGKEIFAGDEYQWKENRG